MKAKETLNIGFIGSGFMAKFHLQSLEGVRNCRVAGVYSTTAARRDAFAAAADARGLGPCKAYASLEDMLCSPDIDAVWVVGPNDKRIEHFRVIHAMVKSGRASLLGVACEKPLARNLAEAREILRLAEDAGLNHGYLENQLFSTAVVRGKDIIWRRGVPVGGRPYLARAAEEHSGPHEPWFWMGERQGGGVLLDMMCHSVEVARYLLTGPDEPRQALKPISASATVANLKWTRPKYVAQLHDMYHGQVDYGRKPSEDFARATLVMEAPGGQQVVIETTTSWAYVGAGLRIQIELLGPEYAMEFSSLGTGLKVFLSRALAEGQGEDMVEKQNAEHGLMPVLEDEPGIYGYTLENRHMVEAFRKGERPVETLHDGVAVVETLMAFYKAAETGETVRFPDPGLETFVPAVARPD